MQNAASTARLRMLIGALAVVAIGAVIWATAAFAGGSSSSGNSESSETPAPAFVQDRGGGSAEDCPEREGEGEESPDVSSNL
jgi:hypothetical protein